MLCITLLQMITRPLVICAVIFAALGIAISLLAKKVTVAVRKTKDISQDDKVLLGMKIVGLSFILIGFVLLFVASI